MKVKKRKSPRHAFRFKVPGEGKDQFITAWADVKRAKREVRLTLTAEDVKRSMDLGGVGNTQTCSMAVCAKRQADAFPHEVEGYIDWQYRRAYVVTKTRKDNGLPAKCIVYSHQDKIAKLNDTKGGQEKLLRQLQTYGPRTIVLKPEKHLTRKTHGKAGKTGERSSRPAAVGAKLRFAMTQLGGVPA